MGSVAGNVLEKMGDENLSVGSQAARSSGFARFAGPVLARSDTPGSSLNLPLPIALQAAGIALERPVDITGSDCDFGPTVALTGALERSRTNWHVRSA
jgi:hypothetical protein